MKKILFDFITFEDKYINGGNLYVKTVLNKILEEDVTIYGLCHSYDKLNNEIQRVVKDNNIELITMSDNWIDVVNKKNFDAFFIGIAQRYNEFNIQKISCKIYIVCHDIGDICRYKAKNLHNYEAVYSICKDEKRKFHKFEYIKAIIKKCIYEKSIFGFSMPTDKMMKYCGYLNFRDLIAQPNVHIITVSNYSRSALEYYFENIANPIEVFYPPIIERQTCEVSEELKELCCNKKYFLFVSADRESKNFFVFKNEFVKFNKKFNNEFIAIAVGLSQCETANIYGIKRANDSELEYLMKNAYCLVYSSLSEGFGYPPIEAMHFGTPVLAAFDTSIPEICGRDVLYFNPQYEEDLYLKSCQLVKDYESCVSVAKIVADRVEEKQRSDLQKIVSYILS